MEYYEKALEILKAVHGEQHPDMASIYNEIGGIYYMQGEYARALEYLQKALEIYRAVLGEQHPYTIQTKRSIDIVIAEILSADYNQAVTEGHTATFLADKVFTATVTGEDTPAAQQGMSGEYILLEFGDWTQDSPTSLFDKNNALRGQPKDIVVIKDGVINRYHFENVIGVQLGIKQVGTEEKSLISEQYRQCKQ